MVVAGLVTDVGALDHRGDAGPDLWQVEEIAEQGVEFT
jgi:hypothetical protein